MKKKKEGKEKRKRKKERRERVSGLGPVLVGVT